MRDSPPRVDTSKASVTSTGRSIGKRPSSASDGRHDDASSRTRATYSLRGKKCSAHSYARPTANVCICTRGNVPRVSDDALVRLHGSAFGRVASHIRPTTTLDVELSAISRMVRRQASNARSSLDCRRNTRLLRSSVANTSSIHTRWPQRRARPGTTVTILLLAELLRNGAGDPQTKDSRSWMPVRRRARLISALTCGAPLIGGPPPLLGAVSGGALLAPGGWCLMCAGGAVVIACKAGAVVSRVDTTGRHRETSSRCVGAKTAGLGAPLDS